MSMKTYSVLYAEDVPNYAIAEMEAEDDRAAIGIAKQFHATGDLAFGDADWENPILRRIVHIEDADGNIVASDIQLDNYTLLTDCKVRDAIQYVLECLSNFKADWLAAHGLKVAFETLESAYAELGGAA
jgi:hypothetical protein